MSYMFRMMRNAAMGLGAVFAGGALAKSLIGFNSRVEDAKNSIAAMLALAKGHGATLGGELGNANKLYDDIRKKASELPGTTEDYVQAMAKLTLPIMTAGGSMEELKDLTVATIVAAKGGVGGATVKTAVTDVLQGIEGRYATTDFFMKAILEPLDNGKFQGEAGRKLFKAMSKLDRMRTLQRGLMNPVFKELAEKQAGSFTGTMDKMKEAAAQFLGRVGLPLFKALTAAMKVANHWLENNKATVEKVADAIGGGLVTAFSAIGKVIKFFADNSDEARAILKALLTVVGLLVGEMLIGWLLFAAPIIRVTMLVTLLWYVFEKLRKFFNNDFAAAIVTVIAGLLLFNIGRVTKAVWGMVSAWRAARLAALATGAAGAAQGAGAAINGMSSMALGPAGMVAASGTKTVVGKGLGAGAKAAGGAGAVAGAGAVGGLAAIAAPFAIAMIVDSLIPTKEDVEAILNSSSPWAGIRAAGKSGSIAQGAAVARGGTTVNVAGSTVTITGVNDAAEVERVMLELQEKQARILENALSGGKR